MFQTPLAQCSHRPTSTQTPPRSTRIPACDGLILDGSIVTLRHYQPLLGTIDSPAGGVAGLPRHPFSRVVLISPVASRMHAVRMVVSWHRNLLRSIVYLQKSLTPWSSPCSWDRCIHTAFIALPCPSSLSSFRIEMLPGRWTFFSLRL